MLVDYSLYIVRIKRLFVTTSLSDLGVWCHKEELEMQKRALVWESGTEEVPGARGLR